MEREEFERPQRARKNTHKWCRGKVGKLHQLRRIKWTERPNSPGNPGAHSLMDDWYAIDLCDSCGKQFFTQIKRNVG